MSLLRSVPNLLHFTLLSLSVVLATFNACSTISRDTTKAGADIPVSTEVSIESVAFDNNYPKYIVSVSPVQFLPPADKVIATTESGADDSQLLIQQNAQQTLVTPQAAGTEEVLAQLITALSNSGNINLLDHNALELDTRGRSRLPLGQHERGPYLVKANITEFGERVEETKKGIDAEFGWLGAILSAAGSASDKPGLFWAGLGIALTNPMIKDTHAVRKGMLVMDVSIVDTRSGRVLESFPASGTFIAEEIEQGGGLNVLHHERKETAQSTMSQAIRIACNEAMKRITDVLKEKGRPKRIHDVEGD